MDGLLVPEKFPTWTCLRWDGISLGDRDALIPRGVSGVWIWYTGKLNTDFPYKKTANCSGGVDLFEYLDYAYGLGLRVMINKKSRANVALDVAWGKYGASGFYLGINEVF